MLIGNLKDIVFWIFFKFLKVGEAQTVCSYRENLESYFWRRFCRKKNRKASSSVNKSWDFREKLPKIFSLKSPCCPHILFMKVSVLYFMVELKLTWCNVPKNEKYSPGKSKSFNILFSLFQMKSISSATMATALWVTMTGWVSWAEAATPAMAGWPSPPGDISPWPRNNRW